ncbi:MAG: STAS domain-containing protein [Chloroflexota bacterium]
MSDIQVSQIGSQATIILGDKLTVSDVPNLKSELKRLIEAGVREMFFDCSQLDILDSTGIGCLVAAHNSLANVFGKLAIIQVSSDIYELLCSMRLDRRISISIHSAEISANKQG